MDPNCNEMSVSAPGFVREGGEEDHRGFRGSEQMLPLLRAAKHEMAWFTPLPLDPFLL